MILVNILNSSPEGGPTATVVIESLVEDGRERVPNGSHQLQPGQAQAFLVHPTQSVRVIEQG